MNTDIDPFCSLLERCGGCAWGTRTRPEQHAQKLAELGALADGVRFVDTPALGLRDRVDLVWEDGRLGLYGLHTREILDLPKCPMLSPSLEEFLIAYRAQKPPIRKGSVRLRASPTGERGVWLDFANQDVKTLFDDRTYLKWLSELAFVEIGQRRKALIWKDGAPKLTDPVLQPWFETYDADMRPIPLYGPVGGFSQAGFVANRALVSTVARMVERSGVRDWVELFSGNGNFALALASRGMHVQAVELDGFAIEGLQKSKAAHPEWSLDVLKADAYLKTKSLPALGGRGLLVDPPRAGMRQVLEWLGEGERPSSLLYVSCFTEVFLREAETLRQMGYALTELAGVDQFSNSPHAEWIALFTFAKT